MSEERKPEEWTMDDENLFKEYFSSLLGKSQEAVKDDANLALLAVDEHRKRFPKRITQDSKCDCGSRCVKCYVAPIKDAPELMI